MAHRIPTRAQIAAADDYHEMLRPPPAWLAWFIAAAVIALLGAIATLIWMMI